MHSLINEFWTTERVDALWPVLQAHHHGREAIRQAWAAVPDPIRLDLARIVQAGRQSTIAATVHVLPVLSPEGCRAILEHSKAYCWKENESEDDAFRMREVVLADVDPEFGQQVQSALMSSAAIWWMVLRGRLPSQLASLQLAQYSSEDRAEGAYHIDRDSNYTCVVSLNPGEIEGGGTDIADGLIGDYHIPKLPPGYGLFIDGRAVHHRGAPVIKGTRKLLVAWAHDDMDRW